jgi:hypothetical protein
MVPGPTMARIGLTWNARNISRRNEQGEQCEAGLSTRE